MTRYRSLRVPMAMLALAATATACSRVNAPPDESVRPVTLPVAATSIHSIYGIQLDLHGSAVVRDRWIYVDIPAGIARTYQGRASAWDLVVRAGVAACAGRGRAGVISEGAAGRIAPLVGLTQDAPELDTIPRSFSAPLHLEVGIPPGTDLTHSWVTLDVSWPIEATTASYPMTASGAIAGTTPDAQSAPTTNARVNESDVATMDILHAPPPGVSCR